MQIAGRPAAFNPSYSQTVSEQASSPILPKPSFIPDNAETSVSGSLSDRISLTISPRSSSTQIAVSSKDTSNPAK